MSLEFQPNGVRHKSPTAYDSNLSIIHNHFECHSTRDSSMVYLFMVSACCSSSRCDFVFSALFEKTNKEKGIEEPRPSYNTRNFQQFRWSCFNINIISLMISNAWNLIYYANFDLCNFTIKLLLFTSI